jgi:hypothetical protein
MGLQRNVGFFGILRAFEVSGLSLSVTTQDFINFWGKFFAFVLLEMIEFSQRFKTF